jgi:hypothetical protein
MKIGVVSLCKLLGVTLALSAATLPARAITAEEVMTKMSQQERFGYLNGLIDMLAYQTAAHGDHEAGNCIIDRFFREKKEESWERMYAVFTRYSDKRPEILLTVLAKQLCKN